MMLPFPSFDSPPVVSHKEEEAYHKGYQEGLEAGRQSMGLYLPGIFDALNNIESYKNSYRKEMHSHITQALEHVLKKLVMPLNVSNKIVQSRVNELMDELDKDLFFTITLADPSTLKDYVPTRVVLSADPTLPATDFVLMWSEKQITVCASQEELNQRLCEWFVQTIEIMTEGEIFS